MKRTTHYLLFVLLVCTAFCRSSAQAQARQPDISDRTRWQIYNRELQFISKDSLVLGEAPEDGLYLFNEEMSTPAVIELDIRGENKMNQSFVGVAFNAQDAKTYEAIYFRPFNFYNPDTIRRPRSVQYVYQPNYPWDKLRAEHPGKYENRVLQAPDPNKWFHVKIEINHPVIKVYVNNNPSPSLVVNSLSTLRKGRVGFMVGHMSKGSFANLVVTPAKGSTGKAAYGNNPAAGRYVDAGDARLYYETYGQGKPVVLLHGGVYGYIDEFAAFIEELSRTNQVICIATRGHGRSAIGNTPFSWQQRADDAYKVIRSITQDSVLVLGFSDGAASGFKLAATHPDAVSRLVTIGFGDTPKGSKKDKFNYNPEMLMSQARSLFETRKQLMPEPERWGQALSWLNHLYNDDYLSDETFSRIKCPTLVMTGDRDNYHTVDSIVSAARKIVNSQVSVIPGCHHVVFFCNYPAVWESIKPFLLVRS